LFTHNNSPGDQPPARDGYCDHAALWEYAPDYRRDLRAFKRGKAAAFFRYVLNFYSSKTNNRFSPEKDICARGTWLFEIISKVNVFS